MKIRINNYECRKSDGSRDYELLKWYTNPYYGKEQQMIDEGWEKVTNPNGTWGLSKSHKSVHESCFKHHESAYVIAFLEINHKEPDINLITVGSRMLDIEDMNDFMLVYKLAVEKIKNNNYDKEEEDF